MTTYQYHLVDVFTEEPFGGNQLAVFARAEGLSAALMQKIARELNLSESAFVFPPQQGGDFRVRFFTPQAEILMAGHPTVGTAYVLRREGMIDAVPSVVFEEGVGLIPVGLRDDGLITMQQPAPQFGARFEDRAAVAAMLSLAVDDLHPDYPVQAVSAGVGFVYVPVRNLAAMARIKLRLDLWEAQLKDTPAPHVFAFCTETQLDSATVHSRMFSPAFGIAEDPATGAASGPLGVYLVRYGIVPQENAHAIISEQGVEMGRPSIIHIDVQIDDGEITSVTIGGRCAYMGRGELYLD